MPDACKIVTATLIKRTIGITVQAGEPDTPSADVTGCTFGLPATSGIGAVFVQVSSRPDRDSTSQLPGSIPLEAIGDSGAIIPPDGGTGGFAFVKNGVGVNLQISFDNNGLAFTLEQEKALAQGIAAQM